MSIPSEKAKGLLQSYQTDHVQNLFAQSSASHVLYEVGESEDNFPKFDSNLVDKVTILAYSILAAGVSLAEVQISGEAISAMEEAGTLLNNVHGPHASTNLPSSFHVLIAAMAFHASGQYSRAFVCLRRAEEHIDLAKIIASFIRKRPQEVIAVVNKYKPLAF